MSAPPTQIAKRRYMSQCFCRFLWSVRARHTHTAQSTILNGDPVRSSSAKNDPKPDSLRARPLVVSRGSEEPGLIAAAAKSMDAFDLVSKERVNTLRPACRSCRQSSGC